MTAEARPRSAAKKWLFAVAASTSLSLLWLAYLNRDGCWLYWRGMRALVIFTFPWVWFILLFRWKWKGRVVLLVATAIGILLWPHYDVSHVVAAEASAVGRLRQIHAAIVQSGRESKGYPATLPDTSATSSVERFYRFDYRPSRSNSGRVENYLVEATPIRRACGCTLSFTMATDGHIYYTEEDRPATRNDKPLE